jgi:hypothetical protein
VTDATKETAAESGEGAIAHALFTAYFEAIHQSAHTHVPRAVPSSTFTETSEIWCAVARVAISLGARAKRVDPRARLNELLGADSTNYLGTGLTLRELMQLHDAEKLAASWALQPREEQRRRLNAVMQLSIELAHVRKTTLSATRLAELAIESVITGDWKMVEEWAGHFSFEEEHDGAGSANVIAYATFRELLLQVLRTEKVGPA